MPPCPLLPFCTVRQMRTHHFSSEAHQYPSTAGKYSWAFRRSMRASMADSWSFVLEMAAVPLQVALVSK